MNTKSKLMMSAAMSAVMMVPSFGTAAVAQDEDMFSLEEIVVTARKKEESLQDAPVAISAFTADNIENFAMQSFDDIARHTPGFSNSAAFGRTTERPVIRGAANILAGVQFGVESGTAYFVDGVYYSGDASALDMDNLERVEIIKGPQSALYGRNTYAGAINFVTRGGSDEFEGKVKAEIAEHDQYMVYGSVGGPIIEDKLNARVSLRYHEYGGEWTNAADGNTIGQEQSTNFNAVIDWMPAEGVDVRAHINYTEDEDGIRPFALIKSHNNNCYPGLRSNANYDPNYLSFLNPPFGFVFNGVPASLDADNPNQYFCGVLEAPEQPTQDVDGTPFLGVEREMINASLKSTFEIGDGYELALQYGYREQDLKTGSDSDHQLGSLYYWAFSPFFSLNNGGNALFNTSGLQKSWDYSLEARLASPQDNNTRWLMGVFYYDQVKSDYGITFDNDPALDYIGNRSARAGIKNKAIFGMVEQDFSDVFSIAAELRIAEEKKTVLDGSVDAELTFKSATPRIVANLDISEDASMYANYAKGLKPGGSNGSNGVAVGQPTYEEEISDNWEMGLKADWLDGRLRTNISVYTSKTNNYQLTTAVATPGGTNVTSIATNQGNAKITGIEMDFRGLVTEELMVGGTYALTNARFTAGCDPFQHALVSGGPETSDVTPECSIAGNKVPMTSEHQASAFVQFERDVSDDMSFFLNADVTYESSKFVQVHNGYKTGSATIFGAKTGVRGENWEAAIFARNLFNEDSIPMATRWFDMFQGFPTAGTSFLGPRAPFVSFRKGRQLGLTVKYEF